MTAPSQAGDARDTGLDRLFGRQAEASAFTLTVSRTVDFASESARFHRSDSAYADVLRPPSLPSLAFNTIVDSTPTDERSGTAEASVLVA